MTDRRLSTLVPMTALLTVGLALAGCAAPEDSTGPGATGSTTQETASTDAPSEDATTEASTSEDTSATLDDVTSAGLAAIATAEAEAGGIAFGIDHDDDGSWDVDVRTGGTAVELEVGADGSTVIRTENDDLDDEDARALDAATVTLTQAIEIAVAETGGVLDDAEIGDDYGAARWQVTVDLVDRDDVDVDVDVTTGEVLRID